MSELIGTATLSHTDRLYLELEEAFRDHLDEPDACGCATAEEQSRLAQRARRSGEEWARQAQEAQSWLLRAALVGGQRRDPPRRNEPRACGIGGRRNSRKERTLVAKAGKSKAVPPNSDRRLPKPVYERELFRLQAELVTLQEWVRAEGARVVVIFEGRDAAGKGSTIKRVTEYLNPRVARIVALPAPTERHRTQWYFQRYVAHLPAAGEIVLFDRSWYNRAGVERVMGFCTAEEYRRFLHQCPIFERLLVEDGIILRKYWFSVSDDEQERRFRARLQDPMRRWKLSHMDMESITRWEDYSRAKDEMFVHTDIAEAPWYVVESEDKRRARINMISHLLSTISYYDVQRPPMQLPPRPPSHGYQRPPRETQTYVPDHTTALA